MHAISGLNRMCNYNQFMNRLETEKDGIPATALREITLLKQFQHENVRLNTIFIFFCCRFPIRNPK